MINLFDVDVDPAIKWTEEPTPLTLDAVKRSLMRPSVDTEPKYRVYLCHACMSSFSWDELPKDCPLCGADGRRGSSSTDLWLRRKAMKQAKASARAARRKVKR